MQPGIVYAMLSPRYGGMVVSLAESAVGAVVPAGMLWQGGWLYEKVRHREGLGFGDVKMIATMGAFLGVHATLLVLILGSILGSVLGLTFILLARKDASSYELPYGSFLGAAALVYVFFWPA
jgi:leader peptidase (prepilin peptidase)/N-methyltransferase